MQTEICFNFERQASMVIRTEGWERTDGGCGTPSRRRRLDGATRASERNLAPRSSAVHTHGCVWRRRDATRGKSLKRTKYSGPLPRSGVAVRRRGTKVGYRWCRRSFPDSEGPWYWSMTLCIRGRTDRRRIRATGGRQIRPANQVPRVLNFLYFRLRIKSTEKTNDLIFIYI